jgi:CBS domain-containing protein/gamma-glutamyl:cysteine ligase YbdK (ATP-grasp superfamily)
MGEQKIDHGTGAEELRLFMQKLLNELRALEHMHEEGLIESGVRRIGAEQELFLIDRDYRPAPVNIDVLDGLPKQYFTTELGRFNIECNLDPLDLGGDCLSRMETQLSGLLQQARDKAALHDTRIVMAGILPTLDKSHLTLDYMTPVPRYRVLNDAMNRLRGGDFEFRIKGNDELIIRHDNVMLESCNTSFQAHFQVAPEEFAFLYNIAQAVTAPLMAAAVNSPLLFGKRLWRETRIALFQQSIDTRLSISHVRDQLPRVSFGRHWIRRSVMEIFQEDISRFRLLIAADVDEDPFEALAAGRAPKLTALRLHNGTVYRWNRPCYGISDNGMAHLRIENRVLPAGPTILDEMANAAFWFGLMRGVSEKYGDITRVMSFDSAQDNFVRAARLGLSAEFTWPGHEAIPAGELIRRELIPLAREGLQELSIVSEDIDRYLGVIDERVARRRTGAQWLIDSLNSFDETSSKTQRLAALTAATYHRQLEDKPVHEWALATLDEAGGSLRHYANVGHLMVTDLFTVNQDDLVDLVAAMMDWEHIRHVPVEDNEHRLVGLVTHRTLLRLMARGGGRDKPVPVSDVMHRDVITVPPELSTIDAIDLMRQKKVGCLPVVKEGRLIGIITERDFMNIAGQLLEAELRK